MKKRILAMILVMTMTVSMTACGKTINEESASQTSQSIPASVEKTIVLDGKEITFDANGNPIEEETVNAESMESTETEENSKESLEGAQGPMNTEEAKDLLLDAFEKTFASECLTMECIYMNMAELKIIKAGEAFNMEMRNGNRSFEFGGYTEGDNSKIYVSITAPDENGKFTTVRQRGIIPLEQAEEEGMNVDGLVQSFGVDESAFEELKADNLKVSFNGEAYQIYDIEKKSAYMDCYLLDGYITKIIMAPTEEALEELGNAAEPIIFTIDRNDTSLAFSDDNYEEIDSEGLAWAMIGGIFAVMAPEEE